MQRYWNLHYKHTKSKDENKKRKQNEDEDEGDKKYYSSEDEDEGDKKYYSSEDEDEGDKKHTQKSNKRSKSAKDRDINENGNSQGKTGGGCPLPGHDKYKHGWSKCFLNPYAGDVLNKEKALEFRKKNCHGNAIWYKNTYDSRFGNPFNDKDNNSRGYQNRGGHGGRGYQDRNGRGGGRGGYHERQAADKNDGYHYQPDAPPAYGEYERYSAPPEQYQYGAYAARGPPQAPAAPYASYARSYGGYGRRM
jgi:hypothetical protein